MKAEECRSTHAAERVAGSEHGHTEHRRADGERQAKRLQQRDGLPLDEVEPRDARLEGDERREPMPLSITRKVVAPPRLLPLPQFFSSAF